MTVVLSPHRIKAGKKILSAYRSFRKRKADNQKSVNEKLKKLFRGRVKKYFLEMVDPRRPITDFVFSLPSSSHTEFCQFGDRFTEVFPHYEQHLDYHYFGGAPRQQRAKITGVPVSIPWNYGSFWTALVYVNDRGQFACDTFFQMYGFKDPAPYLWVDPWFKKIVLTICEKILRTRPHYFYFLLQPIGRGVFQSVSKGLRDLIMMEKWPKNKYLFAVNANFRSKRGSEAWHLDRDFATALLHFPSPTAVTKTRLLPTIFHRQDKIIYNTVEPRGKKGEWDHMWTHVPKMDQKLKTGVLPVYEPPIDYCDLLFFYNLQVRHKTHEELLKNLETRNNPFIVFQFVDDVPNQIPKECLPFIDRRKLADAEFYKREN